MARESLISTLEDLKELLLKEKEALIQNKGQIIEEIVRRKGQIIEEVDAAEIQDEDRDEMLVLIREIKELQKTNAMLTEQAMDYANTFVSAFQKEAKKQSTYSKEGQYETKQSTGILDQSL